MTKTGVSLDEKEMAQDDAEDQLEDATESLNDNTEILSKAIAELLVLKPVCVDAGMSYEERVARRQDETDALHKENCILKAYATYEQLSDKRDALDQKIGKLTGCREPRNGSQNLQDQCRRFGSCSGGS